MKYLLLSGLLGLFMFVFAGAASASDGNRSECRKDNCKKPVSQCCQDRNNYGNKGKCDWDKKADKAKNQCCDRDSSHNYKKDCNKSRHTSYGHDMYRGQNNWGWHNNNWNDCNWGMNPCQGHYGQNANWVGHHDWQKSNHGRSCQSPCQERAPCGFAVSHSWR